MGLLVGLIRMGLEWSIPPPDCGSGDEDKQFKVVSKVIVGMMTGKLRNNNNIPFVVYYALSTLLLIQSCLQY